MKRTLLIWNGMATTQVSGGDIYVKKIIELSNHNFDVILSSNALNIINNKKNLQQVYCTDQSMASDLGGLLMLYATRLIKAIIYVINLDKKYDTVIATSPFLYDLIPTIFTRSNKKVVILFHLIPNRASKNLVIRIRFALAKIEQMIALALIKVSVDTILVGNEELRKDLFIRFPGKRIVIAHAGIDTLKIDALPPVKKDPNMALFVGRLTLQKGIMDLVEVAEKIQKINPRFRLLVVGDGPDRQKLEMEMEKKRISNIKLLGFVPEKEKYELMKSAKFFIFPSYEEGWGIALAEALYAECISICYEIEHYKGLFANYPLYVPIGDRNALFNLLKDNLKAKVDIRQRAFLKRYDDVAVVDDVMRALF